MQLADIDRSANIVSLFLSRADALGDAPMLQVKNNGRWEALSWAEVARQVSLMAASLRNLGLNPGDRVLIVSENRPEWCIADLAIMAAGLVTVPAYITNTIRDHVHILENSGASAAIVSTAKLGRVLLPAIAQTDLCRHVIGIEPQANVQGGSFETHVWGDLLQGDAKMARAEVEARVAKITRQDLACIIYTSGTGGAPRGVRQHHGMLLSNVIGAAEVIDQDFGWAKGAKGQEVFLSFLPLSHAYEHTGGQFLPIGLGGVIYYAEGLDKLASNIEEVQPSIMFVVPRLFEVLRTKIMRQVEKQGFVATKLMDWAILSSEHRQSGKAALLDHPKNFLVERTLRPKIRAKFGGRLKALVSGGAPLNPAIGTFFDAMGLTLLQGYGQTEAGPIISCNRPAAGVKFETVGPPLRGTEVRIAEDGEILVRGEMVMSGYWENAGASANVLKDGWLYTGDVGHFDDHGRIVITDRKKDMIINDKGDNVSPQKIESMLTLQPEIAQVMVSGDRRPYVVGLVVPDPDWALLWARNNGEQFNFCELQKLPAFRTAIREAVDRVNADLSVIERVRQFTFADEPFSIENEEMTPSLKIRRHKLKERYGDRMDALYQG